MCTVKKIMVLMLVLVVLTSTMAIPANAASVNWESQFPQFQLCSTSATPYNSNYVRALQRFLLAYKHTSSMIADNGGVDGSFGTGTESAVKTFQYYAFGADETQIDGKVGSGTWRKIAGMLEDYESGTEIK